ncbi:MAG: hypothetical protein ACLGHO_13605 [Gammaproteobacteria bacterium]
MLTIPPPLTGYLGKRIDAICPFSLGTKHGENHCAHFVSHAMGYDFATTCKNLSSADKQRPEIGASIRVDEIFNVTYDFGPWAKRPTSLTSCLIFVTNSGNMGWGNCRLEMRKGPKKHIGIYVNGVVWHYSNRGDKVVNEAEMLFINKFTREYKTAGQTVEFFYGRFLK